MCVGAYSAYYIDWFRSFIWLSEINSLWDQSYLLLFAIIQNWNPECSHLYINLDSIHLAFVVLLRIGTWNPGPVISRVSSSISCFFLDKLQKSPRWVEQLVMVIGHTDWLEMKGQILAPPHQGTTCAQQPSCLTYNFYRPSPLIPACVLNSYLLYTLSHQRVTCVPPTPLCPSSPGLSLVLHTE